MASKHADCRLDGIVPATKVVGNSCHPPGWIHRVELKQRVWDEDLLKERSGEVGVQGRTCLQLLPQNRERRPMPITHSGHRTTL